MKFLALILLVPIALTALALSSRSQAGRAGEDGGTTAGRKPTDPAVYTGSSIHGNFQEALNDALSKAQTAINKGGADMQFNWELARTSGKRGGITGSQAIDVDIRIMK